MAQEEDVAVKLLMSAVLVVARGADDTGGDEADSGCDGEGADEKEEVDCCCSEGGKDDDDDNDGGGGGRQLLLLLILLLGM